MKKTLILTALCLALFSLAAQPRILFLRGGSGTGGFLEGGADEQLSDITDFSIQGGNHGWGQLADTLRAYGFELVQHIEGPASNPAPVPLDTMDLSRYAVIVFGSNNAAYPPAAVDAVEAYLRQGGAALFISDANWGQDWGDAPSSDQPFLDRLGWTMNQDRGVYALQATEFLEPSHPILVGISAFDGEGVSPVTLADTAVVGVQTTLLAPAKGQVRRNDAPGAGSSTNATPNDAALIVATIDQGRVAGHFDRNTFFNLNGAGTSITRLDNARYAVQLFTWLAEAGGPAAGLESPDGAVRVYPSPAKDYFQVDLPQRPAGQLALLDLQGRLCRRYAGSGPYSVAGLKPGSYILRIPDGRTARVEVR